MWSYILYHLGVCVCVLVYREDDDIFAAYKPDSHSRQWRHPAL